MNGSVISVHKGRSDIWRLTVEIDGRFQLDLMVHLIRFRITISMVELVEWIVSRRRWWLLLWRQRRRWCTVITRLSLWHLIHARGIEFINRFVHNQIVSVFNAQFFNETPYYVAVNEWEKFN